MAGKDISKEQLAHPSLTSSHDSKVKSPSSGRMGESYKKQAHAERAARDNIGGIGSETERTPTLDKMSVAKHGAYAAQEHASKGLHGMAAESTGGSLTKGSDTKGRAYAAQCKASENEGQPKLGGMEDMAGPEGSYMGHFRDEKYLRAGHNSDGDIPMGPGMSTSAAEGKRKSKKADMGNESREMNAKDYTKKNSILKP